MSKFCLIFTVCGMLFMCWAVYDAATYKRRDVAICKPDAKNANVLVCVMREVHR